MEMKTKFKLWDTVFIIFENKIYEVQVYSIHTSITQNTGLDIEYTVARINAGRLKEKDLFLTKEELFKSL